MAGINIKVIAGAAALIVVAALEWTLWSHGRDTGRAEIRAKWDAANLVALKQYQDLERKNREIEDAHRRTVEDNDRAYREAASKKQAEVDGVLADLRGNNLRLRERLRGCTAAAGSGQDKTPGSGADVPAPAGLSRADEEFLVRLAAEADANAVRLAHLQDYVRALPQSCGASG